jgi:hypothetical protein
MYDDHFTFSASVLWSAIDYYCVAVIRLPCDSGDERYNKEFIRCNGVCWELGLEPFQASCYSVQFIHQLITIYLSIMLFYSGQIWTDPFQAPAQHDQIGPVLAVDWDWTKACKLTHRHVSSYFLRPCLVDPNREVQNLHSKRFPTVAFRLYLWIFVQTLTN